jgi:uncharacterized protein
MARKLLKRYFPTPADIKNTRALHFLGDVLHDPNLFHLNRRSVSLAFFWGLFLALMPIPGQMAVCACAAVFFRCNLPICVALAWVTNPLTMVFFFYLAYEVGAFLTQSDRNSMGGVDVFQAIKVGDLWDLLLDGQYKSALYWLQEHVGGLWKPFLVGSLVVGLSLGSLGYMGIQLYWRWHVIRQWEKRKKLRANRTLKN